jgi:hypothetical protein
MNKISLVALDKLYATLIAYDKGYWMKKQSTNISSSFDSIIYVLSHVIKMQLFRSQLRANDVLSHVLKLKYLKYNYYYYFEIM